MSLGNIWIYLGGYSGLAKLSKILPHKLLHQPETNGRQNSDHDLRFEVVLKKKLDSGRTIVVLWLE